MISTIKNFFTDCCRSPKQKTEASEDTKPLENKTVQGSSDITRRRTPAADPTNPDTDVNLQQREVQTEPKSPPAATSSSSQAKTTFEEDSDSSSEEPTTDLSLLKSPVANEKPKATTPPLSRQEAKTGSDITTQDDSDAEKLVKTLKSIDSESNEAKPSPEATVVQEPTLESEFKDFPAETEDTPQPTTSSEDPLQTKVIQLSEDSTEETPLVTEEK